MAKHNGKERAKETQESEVKSGSTVPSRGMMTRGTNLSLGRLRSEFDRLFEDFFRGWGGLPTLSQDRASGWGLDVDDQPDKVVVRAEAPGFEPDDFDLQVRGDQLILCACQSEETKQDGGHQWHRQELYRSVPLPPGIDAEHVDAQYRNGVLTVTLPKTEQGKSRRIQIKT
jgi:HSP20 family protein